MKLGFIGAGRMAEAVIKGLLSAKAAGKSSIIISDTDALRLKTVSRKYAVKAAENNKQAVSASDVVILAVKPQAMNLVLSGIKGKVKQSQLVISIAAGISLKSLEKNLGKVPVVRVMPNNPCLIGEGVSLICGGSFAQEKDIRAVEKIFSHVGDTIRIEERQMNAVTALSGSGPAFIYEVISALTSGGVEAGLTKEMAQDLALKTALGSIKTMIRTKKTPEELKGMVASPGGTTVAGLRVMDEAGFKAILTKAVTRASMRAKEISDEFERSL